MTGNPGKKLILLSQQSIGFTGSCSLLFMALNCASARLDPEHNRALTFDTVAPDDAGVTPSFASNAPVRQAPSQPGRTESNAAAQQPDARPSAEPITCTVDPPDPKPLHTRDWIVYEFSYTNGKVEVQSQRRELTKKARDTARVIGRYAIELWIGCELIDRVRFSFPLQAAEQFRAPSTRHALHEQPSLTANAQLACTVRVPLDARTTRAELVDRGTGARSSLAWPPNLPTSSNASSQQTKPGSLTAAPADGSQ